MLESLAEKQLYGSTFMHSKTGVLAVGTQHGHQDSVTEGEAQKLLDEICKYVEDKHTTIASLDESAIRQIVSKIPDIENNPAKNEVLIRGGGGPY
jgi:flagellar biosynthesis/type III secretory pathway protein FliH